MVGKIADHVVKQNSSPEHPNQVLGMEITEFSFRYAAT
jgi:hypothetical protein